MNTDISKIRIRRVDQTDIAAMTEHRLAYLAEMQGQRSDDYINALRKELSGFFRKAVSEKWLVALVAESEGQVLAYGAMVIRQVPGDLNKSFYLEADILNMYTLPEFRRMGISTLILHRLVEEARLSGISKLALHTSEAGEKLYRNFGFSSPVYPVLELILD